VKDATSGYDFSRSRALYDRAKKVIPRGIYGHYGYAVRNTSPAFFSRSEGARFWDVDGNEFIDYMCGFGPMILGYNHPVVEEAVLGQLAHGNTVSLASPVMVDLAEELVDTIGIADWALFGKNGGDATHLAMMLAREATGRKKVVMVRGGYHGVAPWMQVPGSPGTIDEDHEAVYSVDWNQPEQLEQLIEEHDGEIACFISSPYHHPVLADNELPADGYWPRIQGLCNRAGIVLILDDVRAGFRIDLRGSNEAYGFRPDLICFGKALANGHPISALVGSDAFRQAAADVFYTGTQFFNAAPMAAALATLRELKKIDAARRINEIGQRLTEGLVKTALSQGYDLRASGVPAMPYFRIHHLEDGSRVHRAWIGECVRRGAYFLDFHNHFVSTAHEDADLERTWEIAADAFRAIR
jgi:glutamate-1-semialdehyde 2,1-aminomutase